MKKIPGWLIIMIIFGILIVIKLLFLGKKDEKNTVAKGKSNAPMAVNYVVANPTELVNKVYTTGQVGALNEISIQPEISGKVVAVYFKDGQSVNKGTPLLKINDADLQAQLLKTTTQLKLSQEKLDRLKKLLPINGVSQEEVDIQANEVEGFKADMAYTNAQLAKTLIAAPFSGVVGLTNVSEGTFVSPTYTVASLVQVKPLYIEFSVPERYVSTLKKGMDIQFSYDNTDEDKSFTATIYALEPKIDDATKTLKARALYNGNEPFYPGSFVKVFVDLGKSENAIMVPTQCIVPILKGEKVFISKNGIAKDVKVTTGIRTDEKIQVLEGLNPGDTVLTTGLLAVKKDTKLKLIQANK